MPPLPAEEEDPHQHLPRIITYHQTHHTPESQGGKHISVLPLLTTPGTSLTHLILAAIHLNSPTDPHILTLNDHPPSHPRFTTLWAELRVLQANGIKILGMLGGAAKGSFTRLDILSSSPTPELLSQFEYYYSPLANLIRTHNLDGLDLDVEEETTLPGIIHLIDRLKTDFGPSFIITLAPVASALLSTNPQHNLSGFSYHNLESLRGPQISWYNSQFYCGWGDCSNPLMYEMILAGGIFKPEKIVVGLVTNPENGSGWVSFEVLGNVLPVLCAKYPRFGGVMGWEYFNSLPGGRERPWEWAGVMTGLLRGKRATEVGNGLVKETTKTNGVVAAGDGGGDGNSGAVVEADGDDGDDSSKVAAPVPESFEYYSDTALTDEE